MNYFKHVNVLRYENFVANPQDEIDKVYDFLALKSSPIRHSISPNINEKYFSMWENNRKNLLNRLQFRVKDALEERANKFG